MKNFRNVILDASSLIAFVYAEPGYEVVADILHCSVMSTVNVSEVIKYMLNCNVQKEEIDKLLDDSLSKIIDLCAGHDVRVEGSSPSWADIERSIS